MTILRCGARRRSSSGAIPLAASQAGTLAAVHGQHVIHKDIKPQNIIVHPETEQIKLTDFGISTRLSEGIGAKDVTRAQQVLETAPGDFQARRARVVIIDITGVVQVDAAVAEALIKTAKALQLLGAKAVLSGIRPDVSQALVAPDIQLGSIVTMGTLQSSIAYALGPGGRQGSFGSRAERPSRWS